MSKFLIITMGGALLISCATNPVYTDCEIIGTSKEGRVLIECEE